MKNRFLLIISLITIALITSCSTSNEKANSLYAEAIHIMQSANINKTKSYSKTYELYKKAYKKIDLILSKYPKADIAVEIISGRLKIEKFTLSEFQGLECLLKTWAEAGQDPFLCALLVAKTIEYASYKSSALADIAGKYAETGQKEKATQILSQALETAKTIEDANDKSRALADIAGEYAKAGQKEKANQILSQALETAKTIGDADDKSRALADIAGKYANAGKKPNKEAMVHMHGIVYEANPMAIMKIWE